MGEAAPDNLIIAVTGASGAVLCRELLQAAEADARVRRIHLVPSEHSLRVIAEELGFSGRAGLAEKLLGRTSGKVKVHAEEDIGASIASGSYPAEAMVVIPCSMGTLGGIAHGLARNLIERAADVCLKERRPLVLCVRETPLNLIHIRNMAQAAEAGATVFPVIPAFYQRPQSTEEMARGFAHRVLAHVGLRQPDAYVWKPEAE
jgi:4-hydroxy-3-polyprenylbenzoate decarboxylase